MANTNRSALATTPNSSKATTVHGTYRDQEAVASRLDYAMKYYNLVSPATSCGTLPEGFSLAFSLVTVDIDRDTYEVGDLRGLGKTALDLISNAAGVSWDPRESGRTDDGSDPYYCAWKAVGHVQDFDGRVRLLSGHKEMDLRDGAAQVEALISRYDAKLRKWIDGGRKGYEPKDPREGQIREMRLHIVAHAETKARLRAIRTLGIRAGYTEAELKKPFCVVRLMATGETSDPELRKMFAVAKFQAALEPSRLLYGDAPQRAPQAMAMPLSMPMGPSVPAFGGGGSAGPQLSPPPPVGSVPADEDDVVDAPSAAAPEPQQSTAAPAPPPTPQPTSSSGSRRSSGVSMKFGKGKDVPIEELETKDLKWYIGVLEKDLDNPEKARFRASTEKNLRALRAELAARSGGGSGGAAPPPSFDEFAGAPGDDDIPFVRVERGWRRP